VSYFSAAPRWAPMLGVSENPDRIPEHVGEKKADTFSSSTQMTLKETKNLRTLRFLQKLHHLLNVKHTLHTSSKNSDQ
jgi:hypothetical protein